MRALPLGCSQTPCSFSQGPWHSSGSRVGHCRLLGAAWSAAPGIYVAASCPSATSPLFPCRLVWSMSGLLAILK